MEQEPRATSVSPSEKTIPIDRDRTLVAPRFDEKSVQRARPAVPIARDAAGRFWSSSMLVACIVAGLIGGVAGGLGLALYQKRNAVGSPPPAVAGAPSTSSSPVVAAVVDEAPPAAPAAASVEATAPASPSEVARAGEASAPAPENEGEAARGPGGTEEAELRGALDGWIAATNARDIGRQMDFYGETVGAFYLTRNVPREAVRAEKTRVLGSADAIDIRAGRPAVRLSRD
ncbi:MAG TPA: hypothetical protein VF064_09015, partial [Pyrinomonadaceae bacterium]